MPCAISSTVPSRPGGRSTRPSGSWTSSTTATRRARISSSWRTSTRRAGSARRLRQRSSGVPTTSWPVAASPRGESSSSEPYSWIPPAPTRAPASTPSWGRTGGIAGVGAAFVFLVLMGLSALRRRRLPGGPTTRRRTAPSAPCARTQNEPWTQAESKAYELLDAFEDKLKRGPAIGRAPEEGLQAAASEMLDGVQSGVAQGGAAIYSFAAELERYRRPKHEDAHTTCCARSRSATREGLRSAPSTW